jgi:23S rRNA pseudouridine2605 synthase
MIDNKPLPQNEKRVYILLNKPRGYVTTLSDEKGRKNAAQLVKDCGTRVYPVGRLDMDSEGLLLFTNDGEFANRLMHPRHQIDKTYQVTVNGFTASGLEQLKRPVTLDGYTIQPPQVKVVRLMNGSEQRAILLLTIHEGRNRQVRRMCAMAGMQVTRLIRISEGQLKLGDLPAAKGRYLTPEEVDRLIK